MKIFIGRDTKTIRLKFGGNYKAYIEHGMMTEWDTTVINWTPNGSVIAEVIRGNWVARCPYCPSAIFVDPGHAFYCPSCAMAGNNYQAMSVIWPSDKDRAAIEWLLIQRPNPRTRNWLPMDGETLDTLKLENLQNGHPHELPDYLT